jgi:hypothetical protein
MDEIPASVLGTLQRLSAKGFELLPMPELETHYVVTRDGMVAIVERREDGSFGSSGNPGKLTGRGLALFVRRGSRFLFVAKGLEEEATREEAAAAQEFASELHRVLEA